MLVLSRKRDEKVQIFVDGHRPIEVMVVEIKGDKVRLAFDAEREISIHRQEVAEAIEREKLGAAKTP